MKRCSACLIEKADAEFWKQRLVKDGLQSRCKVCSVALDKNSAERVRKYLRSDKGKMRSSEWSRNNRDKRASYWKKHYEKYREKLVLRATLGTYIRRGAEGSFSKDDIDALLIKQSGRCAFCLIPMRQYHIDHILPISRGGTSWPYNLQLTCPHCNHSKRNRDTPKSMPAQPEFL